MDFITAFLLLVITVLLLAVAFLLGKISEMERSGKSEERAEPRPIKKELTLEEKNLQKKLKKEIENFYKYDGSEQES